jgi:hypothetical protein
MPASTDRRRDTPALPIWRRARCAKSSTRTKSNRTKCDTTWNSAIPTLRKKWPRGATINANGTNGLTINTGNAVTNGGLLEAMAADGLTIEDAVANSGTIAAHGGSVTIFGNLTGRGTAQIFSGNQIELKSTSNSANELPGQQRRHRNPSPRSRSRVHRHDCRDGTNSDTLDLQDINIAGTVSWTFAENSAGTQGTLSITDGTHNAKIALIGHYLAANGIASSSGGANSNLFGTATDGSGGTLVTTTHQAP